MEFHEKLQELRKNREMTQEELAQALYVSRTAISKWESGRGYPNIDSLKDISKYFSISLDDLLSSEKLLYLAEKENKVNIQNLCNLLFGIIDLCSFLLIVLPLYPNKINEHIYSVNLFHYHQLASFNLMIYWIMFLLLFSFGCIKILFTKKINHKMLMIISIITNILVVLFLGISTEAYAITIAFLLLIFKTILFSKYE